MMNFCGTFLIDTTRVARVLAAMCAKCNILQYMLRDCKMVLLVPIYKKGPHLDPNSYRPITLHSHARKVIEAALAFEIRKVYQLDLCQLRF